MERVQGMPNGREKEKTIPRNIIKFKNIKIREKFKCLQREKDKNQINN